VAQDAALGDKASLSTLEKAAAAEDPSAQYGMALYYLDRYETLNIGVCYPADWGYLEKVDPSGTKMLRDLLQNPANLSGHDDPSGERHAEGIRLCDTAVKFLEKSSSQRYHPAEYELGFRYLYEANFFTVMFIDFAHANGVPNYENPLLEQSVPAENMRNGKKHLCDKGLSFLNGAADGHNANAELRLGLEYEMPGQIGCVPTDEITASVV
jgi:TPR repeat protein